MMTLGKQFQRFIKDLQARNRLYPQTAEVFIVCFVCQLHDNPLTLNSSAHRLHIARLACRPASGRGE